MSEPNQTDGARLTQNEFVALMNLMMTADPFPAADRDEEIIERLLASEAARRGFGGWYEAYHEMGGGNREAGDE